MSVRTFHLFLILGAWLLALPAAASAGVVASYSYSGALGGEDGALGQTFYGTRSLFDRGSARPIGPDLQRIFGPRSGHIRYDARMIAAAEIAAERAHAHSTDRCWHSVKNALVAAQVVPSRPTTEYAKEAGNELQEKYGFTKLCVTSPFDAPVGAVLVYGGRGAGHVEIRTTTGFVSDFISAKPSPRPLIGVYVKRT